MKAQQRFLLHDSRRLLLTGFGLGTASRAVIIVPPFAEELNKSRRMLALQGRALGAVGVPCCYLDLSGTGDSDGEFSEARCSRWIDELSALLHCLRSDYGVETVDLLGLRFGAIVANELARDAALPIGRLVFWQPVTNGRQYLKQFLRTRVMAGVISGSGGRESVTELRTALATTGALEVAGYRLGDELACEIEALELRDLPAVPAIHWIEVHGGAEPALSPASRRFVQGLPVSVETRAVQGEPFWSTVEIGLAPALIEATTQILGGVE